MNRPKKKVTPVFSCRNGIMYDVIDGVLIPKQFKKPIYKSNKLKQNGKANNL